MSAPAAARMRAFIADNPKGKHGVHVYTAEEYGIDPSAVRRDFSGYIERFDLAPEAGAQRPARAAPRATMRAWRTHEYGAPDRGAPARHGADPGRPRPGELRVRVQAIPFNLNDLERITGGNMMVRPELPYSPGMEVMGVVDACGAGTEEWLGRRVVAMPKGANGGFAEYAICPVVSAFDMPDVDPAARTRPRSTSRSISRGSGSSTAPSCRPARACSSTRPPADRARPRSSSRSTPARACSRPRAPTRRCSSAATSAPTSRSTTTTPTSPRSCSPRPATAASTSCSTTSARR